MKKWVVRLWVDLVVTAESEAEAKSIANNHRVDVEETPSAELYEIQLSGQTWERECDHDWQEQPGEPPCDTCSRCGEVRY